MDYSIAINTTLNIALFKLDGPMTSEEGKRVFLDYISRPGFDPTATMITDARGVTAIDAGFGDILFKVRSLLRDLKQFTAPSQSIILVGGDVSHGMARILGTVLELLSKIELHVVHTEQEALTLAKCDLPSLADIARGA